MTETLLPSWRPGATRDAVLAFLAAAEDIPQGDRVAYFDNDGTLWCEKPHYVQLGFFLDALERRLATAPALAEREEFAALLAHDADAIDDLGLMRVVLALASLFEDDTPDEFTAEARDFLARHPARIYLPMLELIRELRQREFTVGIVTGGGTEFVRAISDDCYGVPPHLVVGSLIDYEFHRDDVGRPVARRTARVFGHVNEGEAKVLNIQTQLGRRPVLAAGNSSGDKEMLEWTAAGPGPTLCLLVDHDDDVREYAYVSEGQTTSNDEPITAVGARLGWTVVSMARDWDAVFVRDA